MSLSYSEAINRTAAVLRDSDDDLSPEYRASLVVQTLGWREPCPDCEGRGIQQISVSWSDADGMGGGTITQERCRACNGSGNAR